MWPSVVRMDDVPMAAMCREEHKGSVCDAAVEALLDVPGSRKSTTRENEHEQVCGLRE